MQTEREKKMKTKKLLALFTALTMVASVFGAFTAVTEAASMSESTFFAKLNYSAYPALSAVESAVNQKDYTTAKAELLKYYQSRKKNGGISAMEITAANKNIGMANLAMDNILTGPYEFDVQVGMISVDAIGAANAKEYSVDITEKVSAELSNKAVAFMFMERQKQQYPVYIYTKESAYAPKLTIETYEGDTLSLTPGDDSYIHSNEKSTAHGSETTMVVKEQSDSASSAYGTQTRRGYIKFDLSSAANKTVKSATLTVSAYVSDDCTTGAKDVHILSIGDTAWDESTLTWSNTGLSVFSWQSDSTGPSWTQPDGADSEYTNVTSRFWFGRPMAYEYLCYVNDPEGYPQGKDYGEKLLFLMNAFASKKSYGYNRTLETGERLSCWVDIVDALVDTPAMTPDYFYNIMSFIWGDCNYLNGLDITNGSYWWSNWRIVANAGFFKGVEYFPEFKDYSSFRNKVEGNVEYTMGLLYNDDMSFTEAGPSYAQWCAKLFGDCAIMADKGGNPMSNSFITKLTYATRYALNSFYPDGYDSNVGDSNYRDKMPEFKVLADYLNDDVINAYVNGDDTYTKNRVAFYDDTNSLYVRNSWNPDKAVYASFVNNPGDGHYHPDSNQVLMYAYGQPLLVDSGRYGYSATNSIYNELRWASAHNTVEAVGTSMGKHSESSEKFSVMENMGDKAVFATTTQHGYTDTTHTRNMLYLGDYAIVTDYVNGTASRTYRQNWHFMPSNNATLDGKNITTNFYKKANIVLANADSDATAAIRDGYFSADYGLVANSEYASFEKTGSEVKFATVLYPTKAGESATVSANDISADNSATALELNINGESGVLYVKNTDEATGVFSGYETDAKAAMVTDNSAMLVNGTKIVGGSTQIIAPSSVQSVYVKNSDSTLEIYGDSLANVTDKDKAIKIKTGSVSRVILNGEEVEFESDGTYIYAAGLQFTTTVDAVGTITADKDGFVAYKDSAESNEGTTYTTIIQAAISGWASRNAYAAFDLTDYVEKDFNKAVLKMNITEAASGGKIDFYWLPYGTWTRNTLTHVLDSSKMPTNKTSSGATYTGYSYRFDGNVSGMGVGQTFEVDFTDALEQYLANGGSPKFTLAMLSETGSTKFASINHSTLAGPTIVLTKETTEGVKNETKVTVTFVDESGSEIAPAAEVTDVTAGKIYTYDAPEFIGDYALSKNASTGIMVEEGQNYIEILYVPAISVTARYTCSGTAVESKVVGKAAPGSVFTYAPGKIFRTDEGDYLVNEALSTLSAKAVESEECYVDVALDKITIIGDNLASDGSFESGSIDGTVWKRWNGSSLTTDINWVIDTANSYDGSNSLLCKVGGGGTSTGNIIGQFPLSSGVKAGKTYILSMWLYNTGSSLTLTTGLSSDSSQQNVDLDCGGLGNAGTDPVSCNITMESDKWINLSYVLTAKDNSQCAEIYARWATVDGTRIDNIELYEFEYDTIADVKIQYVNQNGDEIAQAKNLKAEIGTTFDASEYAIPTLWKSSGVLYKLAEGNVSVEVKKGENLITLTYAEEEYDGLVLDLSFDDAETGFEGGLGKAVIKGNAPLVEGVKGNGVSLSSSSYLDVMKKDGSALLTDMDEITIAFMSKVTSQDTCWDFFAAPNETAQTYQYENYLGFLEKNNAITVERYKNNGSRATALTATSSSDWKKVALVVEKNKTTLYIDSVKVSEQASSYLLSDILGDESIFQIGKANWGSGEYFNGYIDEFKIYDRALTAAEVATVFDDEPTLTFNGTTATVSGAQDFTLAIAQYNSQGKMTSVKTAKEASLSVDKDADAVKATAFLWSKTAEMKPITKAVTVDYK